MKLWVGLLLLGLVSLCSASSEAGMFQDFVSTYGKPYPLGSAEYKSRFEIFKANLHYIAQHNSENHGFTLGVNKFADLTSEEFAARFAASPGSTGVAPRSLGGKSLLPLPVFNPPAFDWRNLSVIGPVTDQGSECTGNGFVIPDAIGSALAIQLKEPFKQLSIMQIMTCTEDGTSCPGNWINLYIYVYTTGLYFNDTYPGHCGGRVDPTNGTCATVLCNSYPDDEWVAQQVFQRSPAIVRINPATPSFQLYKSGIYSDPKCNPDNPSHMLLIVGYTPDAWICQNTWGEDWGMQGYVQIARGQNICGINQAVCIPTAQYCAF